MRAGTWPEPSSPACLDFFFFFDNSALLEGRALFIVWFWTVNLFFLRPSVILYACHVTSSSPVFFAVIYRVKSSTCLCALSTSYHVVRLALLSRVSYVVLYPFENYHRNFLFSF